MLSKQTASEDTGGAAGRAVDPNSDSAHATHAWIRWAWLWDVAFYLLLVLSLASSLADEGLYGRQPLIMISLSALFGALYWFVVIKHPHLYQRAWPTLLYVATAMILWFVLVWLNPSYHMLLFVLFGQLYSLLPIRWAIASSFVLTALIVLRGLMQAPESSFAWVFSGALTIVFGTFISLWISSIIDQSEERQRLVEELESTRRELAAEERRAGMLEERGRLAREIHDTLAQGFISMVTHLEAAEEEAPGSGAGRRHLEQAKLTARENLVEARRLVAALRPELLEGSSLPDALVRLAARFSEEFGVRAEVTVTGDEDQLPQEVQVTLLRVTQEALTNVRKHARASDVTVTLSRMEDLVVLDVQDDGAGFDPAEVITGLHEDRDGSFGLRAMRERIERLGGELLVESAPGEGTTLAVQLPLSTDSAATRTPQASV